ncbi:MAG: dihydropteroate synthase, partial [Oscillospiraceae bacterium]|nr:dihydropteroate synthase [Oscillospiraceae bacterium]
GTTPEHMAAVVKACKGIVLAPPTKKSLTVVSSYGKSVVFEDKTVIIGERINPTGKPRLKQALRENDMSYIFAEGLNQIEHGAEILDVNTGLPEIDEAQVLKNAVVGLQSITDTPLQIDTSDPIAAENALRIYNGKPLLNSVNGKAESLASILPLVKKYGAAVVALTLDDDGIPDTAQGRMEIAERIIAAAVQHGIDRKDIIIDPLAMTVSTGENNAKITLETIERVRKELGTHTVLGVSNISFGLPEREKISATFFTLAMNRGLSAGIINPLSDAMMDAFAAYNTLTAKDENCAAYITRFAKSGEPSKTIAPTTGSDLTLHDAIVKGLRSEAGQLATTMLENTEPLVIISEHLIPALNKVGENFELGKIFLPQLLMSAEAAKSAFEAIKVSLSKQGESQVRRGKIVLATVKGDVHDIGKNIVKVLLENYNFEVIDLGKNVEPNVIVDTVLRENVRLVGLSALMTTTVVYMEETIAMLRKKAPDCLVMVGGAVLTQEYADRIGADFYSKDAMGSVRYSERVFENEN